MKFKRVNVTKLAREKSFRYFEIDIIRQTAIENLIKHYSQDEYITKERLKTYILAVVDYLLDLMIDEKEKENEIN